MTQQEVLQLLKDLIQDAFLTKFEDGDASGCNTMYIVDHEKLMSSIEKQLEQLNG